MSSLKISLFTGVSLFDKCEIYSYTSWGFVAFLLLENSRSFFPCRQMSCCVCSQNRKLPLQSKRSTTPAGPAKKRNDKQGTWLSVWAPTCLKNWKDCTSGFRVLLSLGNFLGLRRLCDVDVSGTGEALGWECWAPRYPHRLSVHPLRASVPSQPSPMFVLSSPSHCTCMMGLSSLSSLTWITTTASQLPPGLQAWPSSICTPTHASPSHTPAGSTSLKPFWHHSLA